MLQHIESALLAILSLAIGGYSPWVAATWGAQEPADGSGGMGPATRAVAPVPTPTPPALIWLELSPRDPTPREPAAASPAVSQPASTGELAAPEPAVEAAPTPAPAPAEVVSAELAPPSLEYTPEFIEYFTEIGLNVEYGSASPALRRWTGDIRIQVHGAPTMADIRTLHQVVGELNQLVTGIELRVDGRDSNMDIYFAPEDRFSVLEPAYVPVNLGFFRVWWDRSGAIYRARILIASQDITQQERDHLIREELTQSLGLFNDSWRYPDSIFYQGWTDTTRYTDLDVAAIRLLYHPALRPGMPQREVLDVLDILAGTACCAD
jgi:hypothetical protein